MELDLVKKRISQKFKDNASVRMTPLTQVEHDREALIGRKLKPVRIDLHTSLAEEIARIDRVLANLQKNI